VSHPSRSYPARIGLIRSESRQNSTRRNDSETALDAPARLHFRPGHLRASDQGEESTRLDGVTWHALRHTFASRLVAAGVDLRAVQELGGWRTLAMVQRYAHLSPGHLLAAVEKIVTAPGAGKPQELRQDFESVHADSKA
jgi:integrase